MFRHGQAGSEQVDEAALKEALHREFGFSRHGLRLDVGPPVPGLLIFYAYEPDASTRGMTGVFDGKIHTDFEETAPMVLRALGFGEREVDPVTAAAAVGQLVGDPGSPLLDEFALKWSGDPETMTLPRLTDVDGDTALEFWVMTSRRPPWRIRVVARGGGKFDFLEG